MCFQALFSKQGPRYACVDYEYRKEETGMAQDKLLFIFWWAFQYPDPPYFPRSPDSGAVKLKMVYASTKDTLRKALNGIAKEIQANDAEDLDEKGINAILSRK